MAQGQARNPDRIKAAIAVAVFHALIGYAFITGLAYRVAQEANEKLAIFDVIEPPPPPEKKPEPLESKAPEPEGAAAPESIKAVATPKPKIPLPVQPKIRTAPVSGTGDKPGEGTGSGGTGTGTGSGGSGTGTGGGGTGGGGTKAQRQTGSFTRRDYTRVAGRSLLSGTVYVRYTVQPNGRVSDCAVTRSSGYGELDSATCRIIEERFRYRPARDAQGRPVSEVKQTSFNWSPD